MLSDKEIIIRLTLSVVFAGIIGLERQISRRTAGLRTHILVSLGSCLIMLTSLYVFDIYRNVANLDPTRIASGVVTGIGFLGAGAIIRESEGVRGLTTAASVWVSAAIGLAVGCGFYTASFYTTILALTVLMLLRRMESRLIGKIEGWKKKKEVGGNGF